MVKGMHRASAHRLVWFTMFKGIRCNYAQALHVMVAYGKPVSHAAADLDGLHRTLAASSRRRWSRAWVSTCCMHLAAASRQLSKSSDGERTLLWASCRVVIT
jgi:hypothetical protein